MQLFHWKTPSLEAYGRTGIVTAAPTIDAARMRAGAAIYYDLGKLPQAVMASLEADLAIDPERITTGGLVLRTADA